jgi:nitric oxide reductase large subunit
MGTSERDSAAGKLGQQGDIFGHGHFQVVGWAADPVHFAAVVLHQASVVGAEKIFLMGPAM